MRIKIIIGPVLLVVMATVYDHVYHVKPVGEDKYSNLVWSDEFNYDGLPDSNKWSYEVGDGCPNCGWGNHELQYYTNGQPKNVKVENGNLTLTLIKEEYETRAYSSTKLTSKGKGDWKYGRFEIRAKLPGGLGTWPAIWMLPSEWKYGNWPKSGEIDIMEKVGYATDTIVASAHTGAYNHSIGTHKNAEIFIPDNEDIFHNYILEWDENEYRVYVDEQHFFTFKNEGLTTQEWPYDQKFHLLLNIAYGGDWGGENGLDDDALPVSMEIDYVRVYQ
ncbi:MAG: glycoside hydrolase family 16 protein [Reichenbachiella sp.]